LLAINVQSNIYWQKSAYTLIFSIWHGDALEVGTKIEIHNKGLLCKGKIIGNFHFSIVPVGTFGINIFSKGRGKSFWGGGDAYGTVVWM